MIIKYFQYFQFASLLSLLLFFKGVKKFRLQPMLPILLVVCVIECISSNKHLFGLKNNYLIYNLYFIISTPIYFLIVYRILNPHGTLKLWYVSVTSFFSVLFLINFLFFEGPFTFNTLSVIIQQFCLILLSCLILFKLATSEEYFILSMHPYFWFAAGLLIFSLGTLVTLGMNQYIRINQILIGNKALYRTIMPMLNVLFYSLFSYTFYLCERTKK